MTMKRADVALFVDWQAQLINSGAIGQKIAGRAATAALAFVTSTVADLLLSIDDRTAFFVAPKLYHGWHRGLTPTDNYRALKDIFEERQAPARVGAAVFDWANPFGNLLTDCLPHRLHRVLRIHLPNTLRADLSGNNDFREKMVDTALACDVLASARSHPTEIRLIFAEDDDIIPAAFTADAWTKEKGGRTIIARKREESEFLNMSGVYKRIITDAN